MRNLKLFPKTFLYTIGIMSIIVVLVHSLMYVMLPNFYLDEKSKELQIRADELMERLQEVNEEESLLIAEKFAIQYNMNITLEVGEEIYRYQGFTPIDIYFNPEQAKKWSSPPSTIEVNEVQSDSESSAQVIVEERLFNASDSFYLMLNIQPVDESKQVVLTLLPYSIAISFIISLIAAYIYSSVITRPIKNILQVTKEMEKLKKDSFCVVDSEDEIGMLAENINVLYDTLWHTIESLEQKVDDISAIEKEKMEFLRAASHELKTPLTSLSVLLENMQYNIGKYKDRDYYLGQASEMVMASTKVVQNILNTSKLQTIAEEERRENIDVREVLVETITSYEILAKAKDIQVITQMEETCFIHMNKEALGKVFSNLMANAIHYTDQGKQIRIQILNDKISIENECIPLSDAVLSQVFKAFYRPDFSRNKKDGGTGLGLYIVQDILTHASVNFSFTPSDLGMKFVIICPSKKSGKSKFY